MTFPTGSVTGSGSQLLTLDLEVPEFSRETRDVAIPGTDLSGVKDVVAVTEDGLLVTIGPWGEEKKWILAFILVNKSVGMFHKLGGAGGLTERNTYRLGEEPQLDEKK